MKLLMKCQYSLGLMLVIGFSIQTAAYGKQCASSAATYVRLTGHIMAAEDVSAIATLGDYLLIGSDEASDKNKNYIQLLKQESNGSYTVQRNILLFEGNKREGKELDLEGIAVEGTTAYIIGSHSLKRKKIKARHSYQKNRAAFFNANIKHEKNRDWLYKLVMDADGNVLSIKRITLRNIIQHDPSLKTFSVIPSKENGIDIEGIAIKNHELYVGFRGPVFRGNYTPVMRFTFDDAENTYQLLYVRLGGYGIRDIVSVSDGFLILAGSVGDGDTAYQLYHWNGEDTLPGKKRHGERRGEVHLLAEFDPAVEGKAEGMTVLCETEQHYQLMIVYDGVKNINYMMQSITISKL